MISFPSDKVKGIEVHVDVTIGAVDVPDLRVDYG